MKRIIAGPRAVMEALNSSRAGAIHVVYVDSSERLRHIEDLASQQRIIVEERSAEQLDLLSGGIRHQGVLALSGDFPYTDLRSIVARGLGSPFLLVLDEITDPNNFGAIVRSAVAFGVHGVVIPKHRTAVVNATVVRTSAGATEHAHIAQVTNVAQTLHQLRELGLLVVGLAGEGPTPLRDIDEAPAGIAVVVGSEGRGLRRLVRERCDVLAHIEMAGPLASVNASVAAGIALYELAKRRQIVRPLHPR